MALSARFAFHHASQFNSVHILFHMRMCVFLLVLINDDKLELHHSRIRITRFSANFTRYRCARSLNCSANEKKAAPLYPLQYWFPIFIEFRYHNGFFLREHIVTVSTREREKRVSLKVLYIFYVKYFISPEYPFIIVLIYINIFTYILKSRSIRSMDPHIYLSIFSLCEKRSIHFEYVVRSE